MTTSHFTRHGAFYNEIEPFAASWLRSLEGAGHIAQGVVDARDIRQVQPAELIGYRQAHFFAGIGGWSLALRLAGWPDDEPVWTGSCPCQPFSQAGRRGGVDDERHLWPDWFALIRECRPPVIFGEQVAGPDGLEWFDSVSLDLESEGYAVGAADLCSAGVGAPHARQRLYFVANADRLEIDLHLQGGQPRRVDADASRSGEAGRLADADSGARGQGRAERGGRDSGGDAKSRTGPRGGGGLGRLGDADRIAGGRDSGAVLGAQGADSSVRRGADGSRASGQNLGAAWSDAEWIHCLDGKLRPAQPGAFPLAPRVPGDVGRLRGYGNAIGPQVAALFIRAATEAMTCP